MWDKTNIGTVISGKKKLEYFILEKLVKTLSRSTEKHHQFDTMIITLRYIPIKAPKIKYNNKEKQQTGKEGHISFKGATGKFTVHFSKVWGKPEEKLTEIPKLFNRN